jgi:hypothetical protein
MGRARIPVILGGGYPVIGFQGLWTQNTEAQACLLCCFSSTSIVVTNAESIQLNDSDGSVACGKMQTLGHIMSIRSELGQFRWGLGVRNNPAPM